MGIFTKVTGFFGIRHHKDEEEVEEHERHRQQQQQQLPGGEGPEEYAGEANFEEMGVPRRGFSVKVAAVRPGLGPVLAPCDAGDGGIQGLRWCASRLRMDEDGDVAHQFLDEVGISNSSPPPSSSEQQLEKPFPRFQVRHRTRPAEVKNQAMDVDGRLQHCVEHRGRLQWV